MRGPEDWLTLWRVPGIGPSSYLLLLERFGTPEAVLDASAGALAEAGVDPDLAGRIGDADTSGIAADLVWLEQPGHALITLADPRYPPRLREIPAPPPLLYVIGDPDCLHDPQIAIVGARHPTPGGAENARAFSADLAGSGLAVTSGLALGIDSAAHEAALDGGGISIAVTATGPDRIYPARNRNLAHRIARSGAIVTEFPVGTQPKASHFPRRNRIISGLALGTLVVEAGQRSGALITARTATEQGREVFAIPGSIHNPLARGCHRLISQGAKLVESSADILEELAWQVDLDAPPEDRRARQGPGDAVADPEYRLLLEALGHDPVSIDVLVDRSGLTAEAVSSMLLILELNGEVGMTSSGTYQRLTLNTDQ